MNSLSGSAQPLASPPTWISPPPRVALVARLWPLGVSLMLAFFLWVPRLHGPIDLRYDSGVYFILGVSIAEGHGYRLTNEPGAPEAVQYPPLLPLIVAAHAKIFHTTDPLQLGRWLRRTYLLLFLALAACTVGLARTQMSAPWATFATALCLLQLNTFLMSDLLFAELPFALVCVAFVWVVGTQFGRDRNSIDASRLRPTTLRRETASYLLATAGFLLRTAGIALLAAWIFEALWHRQWRRAAMRGLLALVPIGLWQGHVMRVHSAYEYSHPAYAYQRAPYQFYNVTYGENLALADPFKPELGAVTARGLRDRFFANLAAMPTALGEAASTTFGFWRWAINDLEDWTIHRRLIPENAMRIPLWVLTVATISGLVALAVRHQTIFLWVVGGSIVLICSTPWPGQFSRYLTPLNAIIAMAAVVGGLWLRDIAARQSPRLGVAAAVVLGFFAISAVAVQTFTVFRAFERHQTDAAMVAPGNYDLGFSVFYHSQAWVDWERSAQWIRAHSAPDAIVATTAPHAFYLWTGRRAIFPPMEPDPIKARQLLAQVPVSYVIVDELEFLDLSRRYAQPAVDADEAGWKLVHTVGNTRIYAREPQGG